MTYDPMKTPGELRAHLERSRKLPNSLADQVFVNYSDFLELGALVDDLDAKNRKVAEMTKDIASLNQMVRDSTGQGQGPIDAYVAQCEELDRLKEELRSTEKYKTAIEEACMIAYCEWEEGDPKKTLNNLFIWEQNVALDPRVCEEAAKLRDTYKEELRLCREEADAARETVNSYKYDTAVRSRDAFMARKGTDKPEATLCLCTIFPDRRCKPSCSCAEGFQSGGCDNPKCPTKYGAGGVIPDASPSDLVAPVIPPSPPETPTMPSAADILHAIYWLRGSGISGRVIPASVDIVIKRVEAVKNTVYKVPTSTAPRYFRSIRNGMMWKWSDNKMMYRATCEIDWEPSRVAGVDIASNRYIFECNVQGHPLKKKEK